MTPLPLTASVAVMRKLLLLALSLVLVSCSHPRGAPPADEALLIEDVTIVSPERAKPLERASVLIRDGRIAAIGESGKLHYISNLPKVFKGTHVENEEVRIVRARSLELSASRPFGVYADGERLTDLPASLRVLPQALSVLAPPAPA